MCEATRPRPAGYSEYTEAGRAGRMVYLLIVRGPLSIGELARLLRCTRRNIYYLRDSLSSAVPIYQGDDGRLGLLMDMNDWL